MRQTDKTVSPMSNEGRNLYVVEHITNALISLMEKHSIHVLSISQICDEAQVGRASFYRNFQSKEDVLKKYLQKLIQEWGSEFEQTKDPAMFSKTLLDHFYHYKDFYLLLYSQGLSQVSSTAT